MTTRRTARPGSVAALAALLALAGALPGCASVPRPPGPSVSDFVPDGPGTAPTKSGSLSPDGFASAERMAVRVRNVGCETISTGSGFAIDARTFITNRHVVADAAQLQVATYDGRDIEVTAAATAELADLAVVRTAADLPSEPELADRDPQVGDAVSVIGYPQGGPLTVTAGQVIGRTTDPLNENLGEVLVTDAEVEPGSSGSAVLDSEGRVIGVVYAKNAADQSFIVPVSTLRGLLTDDTAFTPVAACG